MTNTKRFCRLPKASTVGCGDRRAEMMQADMFAPAIGMSVRAY